jgi:hypothetical protein
MSILNENLLETPHEVLRSHHFTVISRSSPELLNRASCGNHSNSLREQTDLPIDTSLRTKINSSFYWELSRGMRVLTSGAYIYLSRLTTSRELADLQKKFLLKVQSSFSLTFPRTEGFFVSTEHAGLFTTLVYAQNATITGAQKFI